MSVKRNAFWLPLPGPGRFMTGPEEADFVAKLGAPSGEHERDDITLVLLCFRSATTVEQLTDLLPHVRLGDLADAYRRLEQMRSVAAAAFARVLDNPSLVLEADPNPPVLSARQSRSARSRAAGRPTLHLRAAAGLSGGELVAAASCLMPVPVARIATSLLMNPSGEGKVPAREARRLSEHLADQVAAAEAELTSLDPDRVFAASDRLWNPRSSCLLAEPFYVPARVGLLTPLRTDELLSCFEPAAATAAT